MVSIGNIIIETATGTGTGNLTLTAYPFYRRFSTAFGTGAGNTFYYCIRHRTVNEYEVGTGYMSDAVTLVRSSVIESSNANALVSFSAGDKDCINDIPANLQLQHRVVEYTYFGGL